MLRVGDLPTSKPLRPWLAGPRRAADRLRREAPGRTRRARSARSSAATRARRGGARARAADGAAGREWLDGWRGADRAAARAIATILGDGPHRAARRRRARRAAAGATATLVVAASMPVRDVETFFPAPPRAAAVLSNRGANGIDGTRLHRPRRRGRGGGPAVLLIGDVALAHDIGGLLAARGSG